MACEVRRRAIVEVDIRTVLPEVTDTIAVVRAPELKNSCKGYWHLGTSSVSRVKIDALRPGVEICTSDATKISGTSAEFWQPVQTLGTVMMNLSHYRRAKVHVTPPNSAPFTADGIIGHDYLRLDGLNDWYSKWCDRKCRICLTTNRFPAPPRKKFISDHMAIIRNHLQKNSSSIVTGTWALFSRQLDVLRLHLPSKVYENDELPILSILDEYSDCLHLPGEKLPANTILSYPIKLGDLRYQSQQPKYNERYWDEIEILISDFLKRGIIKPSTSPFNFAVGLEDKPDDSRKRLIVDYTWLNKYLEVEPVPIRPLSDVIDELSGQKYFSVFDLAMASYQIEIKPKDRYKTAFTTRSGHYEFNRMPSTIQGASCYIQRLLNIVLAGMEGKARACHDDIIVYAPTIKEHEIRLRQVLTRIRNAGLSLQPNKVQIFSINVKFLGYMITDKGWFPTPDKIEKLKNTPLPNNTRDLQSYLGLIATIKLLIPNYAEITQPMFDMLKPNNFEWTKEALDGFLNFRSNLSDMQPLLYPNWNRKFHVIARVTNNGFQAVLKQKVLQNRRDMRAVAYASRKFKGNEINLALDKLEGLADIWARNEFSRYLRGGS